MEGAPAWSGGIRGGANTPSKNNKLLFFSIKYGGVKGQDFLHENQIVFKKAFTLCSYYEILEFIVFPCTFSFVV